MMRSTTCRVGLRVLATAMVALVAFAATTASGHAANDRVVRCLGGGEPPVYVTEAAAALSRTGGDVAKLQVCDAGGKSLSTIRDELFPGGAVPDLTDRYAPYREKGYRFLIVNPSSMVSFVDHPDLTIKLAYLDSDFYTVYVVTEKPIPKCTVKLNAPGVNPADNEVTMTPSTEEPSAADQSFINRQKAEGWNWSFDGAQQMVDITYHPPVEADMAEKWAAVRPLDDKGKELKAEIEAKSGGVLTLGPAFEEYILKDEPIKYTEQGISGEGHVQLDFADQPSATDPSRNSIEVKWEQRQATFNAPSDKSSGRSQWGGHWRTIALGMEADQELDSINGTVDIKLGMLPNFQHGLDFTVGAQAAYELKGGDQDFLPRATAELTYAKDLADRFRFSLRGRGWFNPQGSQDWEGHLSAELSMSVDDTHRLFLRHIAGAEPPEFNAVNEFLVGVELSK